MLSTRLRKGTDILRGNGKNLVNTCHIFINVHVVFLMIAKVRFVLIRVRNNLIETKVVFVKFIT